VGTGRNTAALAVRVFAGVGLAPRRLPRCGPAAGHLRRRGATATATGPEERSAALAARPGWRSRSHSARHLQVEQNEHGFPSDHPGLARPPLTSTTSSSTPSPRSHPHRAGRSPAVLDEHPCPAGPGHDEQMTTWRTAGNRHAFHGEWRNYALARPRRPEPGPAAAASPGAVRPRRLNHPR